MKMCEKKGRKQSEATKEKLRNQVYWRHWQKLTEDNVREIRKLMKEGASDTVISQKFGVSSTSIYNIKIGRTFRWVK